MRFINSRHVLGRVGILIGLSSAALLYSQGCSSKKAATDAVESDSLSGLPTDTPLPPVTESDSRATTEPKPKIRRRALSSKTRVESPVTSPEPPLNFDATPSPTSVPTPSPRSAPTRATATPIPSAPVPAPEDFKGEPFYLNRTFLGAIAILFLAISIYFNFRKKR